MTYPMPPDTDLDLAAALLRSGGIVAFPTETVYGLGADAFNSRAVARVFEVKNRPSFDPLIVHVADMAQAEALCLSLEGKALALAERFWPGPLTIVLEKRPAVPDIVTAGLSTVGVRMPSHPAARELIARAGRPIAAPSANPFGYLSPTTAEHVREQLGGMADMVLDGGPCAVGVESTIVRVTALGAELLRPGGISPEEIEAVTGPLRAPTEEDDAPLSPGRLPRHYSPRKRLILVPEGDAIDTNAHDRAYLLFMRPPGPFPAERTEILSPAGDLTEAAANLFTALHRLERLPVRAIVAESVPEQGLGRAIMDRLRRAASPGPGVP